MFRPLLSLLLVVAAVSYLFGVSGGWAWIIVLAGLGVLVALFWRPRRGRTRQGG